LYVDDITTHAQYSVQCNNIFPFSEAAATGLAAKTTDLYIYRPGMILTCTSSFRALNGRTDTCLSFH